MKSGDSIEGKVIELTPYSVKIQLSDQIENEIGMSDIIKITSRKLSPEEIQELFQKDKESTEKLSPKEIIEEKFFQLEDTIVVTASKKNQKIGDAPAIITVFTDKEIEDLGIQSMNELITFLPGFYSTNDLTRVPNRLSVRGIQNSTLILVDGIPIIQKNIVRGFNDFPITIASVKRVEVIRGPGSVTWGANAFMGIINIITRNSEDIRSGEKRVSGKLTIKRGNWDTSKAYFNGDVRLSDSVYFSIVGAYENSLGYPQDIVGNNTREDYRPYTDPGSGLIDEYNQAQLEKGVYNPELNLLYPWQRTYGGTKSLRNPSTVSEIMSRLFWQFNPKGNMQFSYMKNNNKTYFPVSGYRAIRNRNQNGYYEYPFNVYNYILQYDITKNLSFSLNLSRYDTREWEHFSRFAPLYNDEKMSNLNCSSSKCSPLNRDAYVQYQGNYLEPMISYTNDLHVKYEGIPYNKILLGFTYFEQSIPALYYSRNDLGPVRSLSYIISDDRLLEWKDQGPRVSKINSAYLQDEIQIGERIILQPGLRYDTHQYSSNIVNPKFAFLYKITKSVNLKLLYGRGFREPSFNNLFSTQGTVGSVSFANRSPSNTLKNHPNWGYPETLEPERSEAYESQLSFYINKNIRTNLNAAHSRVSNLIKQTFAEEGWSWFGNSGELSMETYELELKYLNQKTQFFFFKPGSYLFLNHTYNRMMREISPYEGFNIASTIQKDPEEYFVVYKQKFYTAHNRVKKQDIPRHSSNFGSYIKVFKNFATSLSAQYFTKVIVDPIRRVDTASYVYPDDRKEYLKTYALCSALSQVNTSKTCEIINRWDTPVYGHTIGDYFLIHLGFTYSLSFEKDKVFKASLHIRNLLDRKYDAPALIMPNPQAGRHIVFSLSQTF
ncbi:MAG: TonB-dependent receptor [Leptospiraceae bacterium]|nr:TonB-dependent receptor [Leptospiraceae bacterium]MCP5499414.1 TonB-dependent receptor [Leptospiraceae bacterium]